MQHATLCYVFDGNEVLLIRQQRGIGEGKINSQTSAKPMSARTAISSRRML